MIDTIPHGTSSQLSTINSQPSTFLEPETTPDDVKGTAESDGDTTQPASQAISPALFNSASPFSPLAPVQPVSDVPAYLKARSPVPHFSLEYELFITLPEELRAEVEAFLGEEPGEGAFGLVQAYIKGGLSVQKSCVNYLARRTSRLRALDSLKTFREKFDLWAKSQDWLVLVNRSKAGADWQKTNVGLPSEFIEKVCAGYFARFKRADGKRQAIFAIKRWWRTGRDLDGNLLAMPGYESGWNKRKPEVQPDGWHYSNILRQIKARAAFTRIDQKLLQEGVSAAKELLPQVHGTRNGVGRGTPCAPLRFLERVSFDDLKTDFLVFDTETGRECELWLLIARDEATGMVLGFVMHLSRARKDGSTSHLGLQEMKQLAAWLLERYPLPPYICTWRVERGTATLSEGSAAALQEMLPNRIKVSYTSMIGGQSPVGYKEKKKGNSRGKGSHESHNRLFHTQLSYLPGQTGSHYEIRPADLVARSKESVEIWETLRPRLPEHLRGQEHYSLLTPAQAREHLIQACIEQNFRTDHELEGFDEVLEWLDPVTGTWQPSKTFPSLATSEGERAGERGPTIRHRKERPVERAIRLMAPYAGQWEHVSPDVIVALLAHTQRFVPIKPSGQITFDFEDRKLTFDPPPGFGVPALAGSGKVLAYHSAIDPLFLHVTDGKGSILGTWFRRNGVAAKDQAALQEAIRYTANALKAAQARAAQLAAPERNQLEAMRAHNAELERGNEFIDIADAPRSDASRVLTSPVATGLATTATTRSQTKAKAKAEQASEERARENRRKAASMF